MKKYENLITETKAVEDIQELESSADLFQFGLDKGYYTRLQQQEYNKLYWQLKDRFISQAIESNVTNINYIDLLYIVSKAPVSTKENYSQLINYVNKIIKNLKKSKCA